MPPVLGHLLRARQLRSTLPARAGICVEVRSPSNSEDEPNFTTRLFLETGAKEVWMVLDTREARFCRAECERPASEYGLDPRPLLDH